MTQILIDAIKRCMSEISCLQPHGTSDKNVAILQDMADIVADAEKAVAAPAPSELPLPEATLWMTRESRYRLAQGGNCKGAVPVHSKQSSTAKLPLFTADQLQAHTRAALAQPAAQDKLTAAAPELLAALKATLLYVPGGTATEEAANAAIAKATGAAA